MLIAHVALLDVENRVLLYKRPNAALWDLPGCAVAGGAPDDVLIQHLAAIWAVASFARALFPLSFCTIAHDANETHDVHVVYGCRNWVGASGLLSVQNDDAETLWTRPARLLDRPVTASCQALYPNMLTLIG